MRHRAVIMLIASGLLVLAMAGAAQAEGETVQVVSQDCDGIMVRGGGYTPGQDLLLFARAPQGEGTITDPVVVQADADGMAPTTTLKFGGQVPDGTYLAVITTPGPGGDTSPDPAHREEVTQRFTVSGCGPAGGALPFTGPGPGTTVAAMVAVAMILVGLVLVRKHPAH